MFFVAWIVLYVFILLINASHFFNNTHGCRVYCRPRTCIYFNYNFHRIMKYIFLKCVLCIIKNAD